MNKTLSMPQPRFSLRRVGRLMRLDIDFYCRQMLQTLLSGFLAGFIPIVLYVLISVITGSPLEYRSASVLFFCSLSVFIAIGINVLLTYNRKIHTLSSPLFLQVPATTLEKFCSLLLMTLALLIAGNLLGPVVWIIYMLSGVLQGIIPFSAIYAGLRDSFGSLSASSLGSFGSWYLFLTAISSYSIYFYSMVRPRKAGHTILWCMGIYIGLCLCLLIAATIANNLWDFSIIRSVRLDDQTGSYVEIVTADSITSVSMHLLSIPGYLFTLLMLWLSYRSLRKKQVN